MYKKCTKCLEKKELNFFSKDLQKKDGLRSSCKLCNKKGLSANEKHLIKMDNIMSGFQICTKCGINKEIGKFVKDSSKKTGYCPSCRDCYRKRLGHKKITPAIKYNCDGCKKEFKPKVNQLNNKSGVIHCSTKCKISSNIENRKTPYGGYRKYILERDGNKCIISGDKLNLDIHHIKSVGSGGTNEYSNLVTLSRKVHCSFAHGKEASKYKKIFLEYTSKLSRPIFWGEIIERSKGDNQRRKDTNKRRKKEEYRKKIDKFKTEHNGLSPTQYKYRQQKEYLKKLNE